MFTVNAADGSVITLGTMECYMGITTYGSVTFDTLTSTSIYTKTEVDNLLTPRATVTYVSDHLQLKVNTSDLTTALALKSKSTDHLHQDRNR